MNIAAFGFASVGVVITLIGFVFANGVESKFMSLFVKILALLIGFFSMPALQALTNTKEATMAGGYWVYMLVGLWWLSRVFKAQTIGGSLAWFVVGWGVIGTMIAQGAR